MITQFIYLIQSNNYTFGGKRNIIRDYKMSYKKNSRQNP